MFLWQPWNDIQFTAPIGQDISDFILISQFKQLTTQETKEKMLEHKEVDLVAGPDAYRDLPRLLSLLDLDGEESEKGAMNV